MGDIGEVDVHRREVLGDIAEIWGRYGGDIGEVDVHRSEVLAAERQRDVT